VDDLKVEKRNRRRTMKAIYKGPDKEFSVDEETYLWLCRMCVGEGGYKCSRQKATAMMLSMANRYLLWPGRKHYKTFVEMLRAFSQPINPRWQRNGDLAKKYIKKHGLTGACHPNRLNRREQICNLGIGNIPELILDVSNDFQIGTLEMPPIINNIKKRRISNWASYPGVDTSNPQGININGDWFFEDRNLNKGEIEIITEIEDDKDSELETLRKAFLLSSESILSFFRNTRMFIASGKIDLVIDEFDKIEKGTEKVIEALRLDSEKIA